MCDFTQNLGENLGCKIRAKCRNFSNFTKKKAKITTFAIIQNGRLRDFLAWKSVYGGSDSPRQKKNIHQKSKQTNE